ncbi:hypothetical protein GCM10010145_66870 [Streptomyces ruber]|uniref:DUF6875 domain-containing protein n=2 Tax=Streptomyces TaxID=1883 RepID=A0A918F0A3_9ACTN|nr:hypothetical protein [Streptomyces ruber]GGQ88093.1 hypothetical protein GCM10010145_66870 [Streptomyces ruber]
MLAWIDGYLVQPHSGVGREGSICPFVGPSLKAHSLRLEVWPVAAHATEDELRSVVDRMAGVLTHEEWGSHNPALRSLVVVLGGLAPERHTLLDRAQAAAKPGLAARGLMLGQFHPRCDERAARNPVFRVSRCPVALLAIRHMSLHDILFLHQEPHLFACYRDRFGTSHAKNTVADPVFTQLFDDAARRWPTGGEE